MSLDKMDGNRFVANLKFLRLLEGSLGIWLTFSLDLGKPGKGTAPWGVCHFAWLRVQPSCFCCLRFLFIYFFIVIVQFYLVIIKMILKTIKLKRGTSFWPKSLHNDCFYSNDLFFLTLCAASVPFIFLFSPPLLLLL